MDQISTHASSTPVVTEIPRYNYTEVPTAARSEPRRIPRLNLILFLLTLLTTTMAGAYAAGANLQISHPIAFAFGLASGLSFSLPLMAILLAHELGHYFTARWHGVETSLPYFLPAPFPSLFFIGTFGAFIRLRALPRSRRVMFDIGAAGPWAGMLVAFPVLIAGLTLSTMGPLSDSNAGSLNLGNSILFWSLTRWILHVDPDLVTISLHPMAFAGWIGLLVTTLNLLPVGQLDGGHTVYALLGGRLHRAISRLFIVLCVLTPAVLYLGGFEYWPGWIFWAVLLVMLGLGHPVTEDANTPLNPARRIAAWATVVLFIVTFMPVPVSFAPPSQNEENREPQVYDIMRHQPAPPSLPGGLRL